MKYNIDTPDNGFHTVTDAAEIRHFDTHVEFLDRNAETIAMFPWSVRPVVTRVVEPASS